MRFSEGSLLAVGSRNFVVAPARVRLVMNIPGLLYRLIARVGVFMFLEEIWIEAVVISSMKMLTFGRFVFCRNGKERLLRLAAGHRHDGGGSEHRGRGGRLHRR